MGPAVQALAFVTSVAPSAFYVLAPRAAAQTWPAQASLAVIAMSVWVLFAGVPQRAARAAGVGTSGAGVFLALPCAALGFACDRARGMPYPDFWALASAFAAAFVLARTASHGPSGRGDSAGAAWLAVVLGPLALCAAWWVAWPAAAGDEFLRCLAISPAGWTLLHARNGRASVDWSWSFAFAPLCALALCAWISTRAERADRSRP